MKKERSASSFDGQVSQLKHSHTHTLSVSFSQVLKVGMSTVFLVFQDSWEGQQTSALPNKQKQTSDGRKSRVLEPVERCRRSRDIEAPTIRPNTPPKNPTLSCGSMCLHGASFASEPLNNLDLGYTDQEAQKATATAQKCPPYGPKQPRTFKTTDLFQIPIPPQR